MLDAEKFDTLHVMLSYVDVAGPSISDYIRSVLGPTIEEWLTEAWAEGRELGSQEAHDRLRTVHARYFRAEFPDHGYPGGDS